MKIYKNVPRDVEYSTDRDFFLENQIVCIVSREGTKFCSLIENRLFMRSQSRHISKRMQLHIMCRNPQGNLPPSLVAANRWNDLATTPHLNSSLT